MHLKSIALKGFKSFPDRTRLEFGPGVSVIVGPNGSGKSNITDAVLWALGEQSPLAVRGQSMQDVIFSGARGQQARRAAEVELVIDNADGAAGVELSELAISRRLGAGARSGARRPRRPGRRRGGGDVRSRRPGRRGGRARGDGRAARGGRAGPDPARGAPGRAVRARLRRAHGARACGAAPGAG